MIRVAATNIISPLGMTTMQNYQAVRAGNSALRHFDEWEGIGQEVTLAAFTSEQKEKLHIEGYTQFESLVMNSVRDAVSSAGTDLSSPGTGFILSTTKGNVSELGLNEASDGQYLAPGATARKIASALGFSSDPIVVCNACISGVTAQILADRLINAGIYDTVVVCGADVLSSFTVAGFLSFKSLSPLECRPFDIDRLGLNLGEAAATIVYTRSSDVGEGWNLVSGALDNDAYHLSAPSPTGDGVRRAVLSALRGVDTDDLAFISAHGTATMFNDQMESKAIEVAGLSDVPVSALKGYFGHTLGAAGVLESIISMCSVDDGIVLPVKGFSEIGVSGRINVSSEARRTGKNSLLKILSGFGGCNGAVLFSKEIPAVRGETLQGEIYVTHYVKITPESVSLDGETLKTVSCGCGLLDEVYSSYVADWPKFHKMDMLGKLVFLSSELMLRREGTSSECGDRSIVLFNGTSSVVQDRIYLQTFTGQDGFFPSPSVFLYTLPNISIGEVAIKNSFKGESSLYILDGKDESLMETILRASFKPGDSVIAGWADCNGEGSFEAEMKLIEMK